METNPQANPQAIRGVAALVEMIECIGATEPSGDGMGDHAVAKILVENEMELRALVRLATAALAEHT